MNKIWYLLIGGIILRLLLSFSTFHPDIRALHLGGYFVAQGHILDLYDVLAKLPANDPLVQTFHADLLIYPPAIYWLHGLFNVVWSLINPSFNTNFIENADIIMSPEFQWRMLLLKIPYLLFDLLASFCLLKIFKQRSQQILALAVWLFNPITLYATYMVGQFDVIAASFILLSLYFLAKGKNEFAALSLGGGIAFKIYPILLLLILVARAKSWRQKILLFVLGISPYLLTILPYLWSPGFRSSALVAGQTSKSLYAQIPVSGGQSIIVYLTAIIFFLLLIWHQKEKLSIDIWKYFFIGSSIFFILTHYHPQWFIWLIPFFVMDAVISQFRRMFVYVLIGGIYILNLFTFDPSLTVGIFGPISRDSYTAVSLWQQLGLSVDITFLRNVLHSFMVGCLLYLIYCYAIYQDNKAEADV